MITSVKNMEAATEICSHTFLLGSDGRSVLGRGPGLEN